MREQATGFANAATTTTSPSASNATCATWARSWARKCWASTARSVFPIKRVRKTYCNNSQEAAARIWWAPSKTASSMSISISTLTKCQTVDKYKASKPSWLQLQAVKTPSLVSKEICRQTITWWLPSAVIKPRPIPFSSVRMGSKCHSGDHSPPTTGPQDSLKPKNCEVNIIRQRTYTRSQTWILKYFTD